MKPPLLTSTQLRVFILRVDIRKMHYHISTTHPNVYSIVIKKCTTRLSAINRTFQKNMRPRGVISNWAVGGGCRKCRGAVGSIWNMQAMSGSVEIVSGPLWLNRFPSECFGHIIKLRYWNCQIRTKSQLIPNWYWHLFCQSWIIPKFKFVAFPAFHSSTSMDSLSTQVKVLFKAKPPKKSICFGPTASSTDLSNNWKVFTSFHFKNLRTSQNSVDYFLD